MLRRIRTRASDERGIALVIALLALSALAAGVTTVVYVSSSTQSTATRDRAQQNAYSLAEAGIANAMSVLHGAYADGTQVNALDPNALPPPPPSASAHTDTYSNGSVTWGGTLDTSSNEWTIVSIGEVDQATGPGTPTVYRKLTAVSKVHFDYSQKVNNQVWNYIYAFGPPVPGQCQVTIGKSSINTLVAAPIFAEGNLCLIGNGKISGSGDPQVPVSVVVKGETAFGNGSMIGDAANGLPVEEAHLAGGCEQLGGSKTPSGNTHTCDPNGTDKGYINANVFDTSAPDIGNAEMASSDYDQAYSDAQPGPAHPCSAGSTGTTDKLFGTGSDGYLPIFDHDTVRNDSNASDPNVTHPQNLTPSESYSCLATDSFGNTVGQITWDASSHKLTVNGEIFVDGNVTISPSATVLYSGQATIYVDGYFTLGGNVCGLLDPNNSSSCDNDTTGGWNPNDDMLIVVAIGSDANGNGVSFAANGLQWQGGFYTEANLALANNVSVEGPMIAKTITIDNNVMARPFPVITSVPVGAPQNPNVYADASPPQVTG